MQHGSVATFKIPGSESSPTQPAVKLPPKRGASWVSVGLRLYVGFGIGEASKPITCLPIIRIRESRLGCVAK